jgi:hypothetical protein
MTTDELNSKIEQLCVAKGLHFKPHEGPPWQADNGPCPWPAQSAGGESWPKAQALRRMLIAEIERVTIT